MRLTGIRLAGFKTFVDPTQVSFLGNRSAVVGPNGCGKSNVIDAVRWVIGESSARRLRGESSTDVIFEGSSARPPTAMASVELTFDNSDGRVGGQYARFGEVAIRREVARTGQSAYFLNGTRCRRRDVVDVFLGTGFGPRSYSIIEQGMIGELIAAKPDDLRAFLEEAAGISRYKERRRETESRMKVTRGNLERLEDIRAELATRLERLQRQAKAAARYRDLKAEQRLRTGELALIGMRAVDQELTASDLTITELDAAYQKQVADIRRLDHALERARGGHRERTDELGGIQGHGYRVEADIGRMEEALQHRRAQVAKLRSDLSEAEGNLAETAARIAHDEQAIGALEAAVAGHAPAMEAARRRDADAAAEVAEAEEAMAAWQAKWDRFHDRASGSERERTAAVGRVEHLEQSLAGLGERAAELASDTTVPAAEPGRDLREMESNIAAAEHRHGALEAARAECLENLLARRGEVLEAEARVDGVRAELQSLDSEAAALTAVQEAALGGANGEARRWMEARGLGGAPRLGHGLVVAPGWEQAVEAVLGQHLQAVRVDDTARFADSLGALEGGRVGLYEGVRLHDEQGTLPALATLVETEDGPLGTLLAGVFAAESLEQALAARSNLAPGESIVTPEGIWMGCDWVRLDRGEDPTVGVVARAAKIGALDETAGAARRRLGEFEAALSRLRGQTDELDAERGRLERECRDSSDALAAQRAERDVHLVRVEAARNRLREVERERARVQARLGEDGAELEAARGRVAELSVAFDALRAERGQLETERERVAERLATARSLAVEGRDGLHASHLEQLRLTGALDAARAALVRLGAQRADLTAGVERLRQNIAEGQEPLPELTDALDGKLAERLEVQKRQAAVQRRVEEAEREVAALTARHREAGAGAETARDRVEEARLAREEVSGRRRTLEDQLRQTGLTEETVSASLPEDATGDAWVARLEGIERRITRLGAINLAAIEEFEAESERKRYLDAQHDDLEQALATLQSAIGKIDRETRTRFKATFDEVNVHLNVLFPKLFGGGKAYLELTGDNLLDTGVRLMARPPGKRNSNVHMLSGGEKALAAIALVFAIFQLNPSPVCLLDEVDAPLDDANVARFAELLHEMSKDVQFVVITHNKLTMEMADHLLGVTMHEPGVSRLVSVDVEEAAALAVV